MKEEQSPGLLFHEISEPQKHHFFSSFVRLRQKFIGHSFKHSFKALKLVKWQKKWIFAEGAYPNKSWSR
jgi:hypothetical protein